MRPSSLLLCALALGALAGCGDDAPPPSPAGGPAGSATAPSGLPDPCTLVTAADVQAVLGTAPQPPEAPTRPAVCSYTVVSPGSRTATLVVVQIERPTERDAKAQLDLIRAGIEGGDTPDMGFEAVPGLGDAALWYGPDKQRLLAVVKGLHLLHVGITFHEGDTLPLCRSLAERALARLP